MKTWIHFFSVFSMVLLLAACQENTDQQSSETPAQEAPPAGAPQGKRANFDGTYEHQGNNADFNAEMIIEHLGNDRFSFNISTGTASGCSGNIEGEAVIGTDSKAVFSSAECGSLTFTFGAGQITVVEKDCDGFHGMKCPYDGVYIMSK